MYTTPLISTLVSSLSLNHHLYADDTQLFLSFHTSDFHSNISVTYKMLYNISLLGWLPIFSLSALLKLNFFLLDLSNNSLKYRTALSLPTHSARNLGFIFDQHPTFSDQITALSKSCYYPIRELRSIRPYLDFKTASTIATSIVHSKLDYCNSIITFQTVNLTGSNRFKTVLLVLLLRLLNPHITPILKSLHWLKVNELIEYKLFSLTKFLQLLNLAIFTTLSLFNLLAVPAPHLLSLSPPPTISLKITLI